MSDNGWPWDPFLQRVIQISDCLQSKLFTSISNQTQHSSSSAAREKKPSFSFHSSSSSKLNAFNHDTDLVHVSDLLSTKSKDTAKENLLVKLNSKPTFSSISPVRCVIACQETSAAPVTKEELGRATWTFLHTLAAQYPENPTRQQKKDVKELVWYSLICMAILSRMYPCKECADHFKQVISANPVHTGSHTEFSRWLCHAHNVVNRSLGKVVFPCERIDARWGKIDCEHRACDLQGTTTIFGH